MEECIDDNNIFDQIKFLRMIRRMETKLDINKCVYDDIKSLFIIEYNKVRYKNEPLYYEQWECKDIDECVKHNFDYIKNNTNNKIEIRTNNGTIRKIIYIICRLFDMKYETLKENILVEIDAGCDCDMCEHCRDLERKGIDYDYRDFDTDQVWRHRKTGVIVYKI